LAPHAQWWLGQAYAFGSQEREALRLFDAAASRNAGMVSAMSRVFAAALRGEREEVLRKATNEEVGSVAMTDEYYPTNLAAALAHIGEHDRALVWLEQAVRCGFTNDRWFRLHNRLLEPLRGHPRFTALMERARRRQLHSGASRCFMLPPSP
jgi:hypothetical protein